MVGRDLLIAVGGRAIAAQRSCSPNIQQDTIEVCSPVSGPWKEFIPGTIGWDVSCDGLIYAPEYADELMEVLTRRQKVRLSYYDPELRIVRSGYAIPTGLQQGASINSLATYSLSFQGSGPLEKVEWTDVTPENVGAHHYIQLRVDKNHNLYSHGSVSTYLRRYKFTLTQTSRVRLSCLGSLPIAVLVSNDSDLYDAIEHYDNLTFLQRELMHISGVVDGLPREEVRVLPAGDYVVLLNDRTDAALVSLKTLSLPTE